MNLDNVEACAYCKKPLEQTALETPVWVDKQSVTMTSDHDFEILTPITSASKAQQKRPHKAHPAPVLAGHPDDMPSQAEQASFVARQAAKRKRNLNIELQPSTKAKSSPRTGVMLVYIGVMGYILWRWLH